MSTLLTTLFASIVGESEENSDILDLYAHNMKQYLLLNQELISRAQHLSPTADLSILLKKMRSSLLHGLQQTNLVLLTQRDRSNRLEVHPVIVEANELIRQIIDEYSPLFEVAEIALHLDLSECNVNVALDPAIFPSVIINLLDNAIKYSKPGGSVSISSKTRESVLVIEISDNGIGIPEEDRELIFSKHFRSENTSHVSGSGLGLYMAKKIVLAHNGAIKLEKTNKFITTFCIELPIAGSTSKRED
ncbi:MAG: HAMP domain-containing histidine kinase [Deltaproteobacteria bacterium]|nr:HAMP domain-containing histidine kinase [Deltaproteobacteria bacterium]